MSHSLRPHGLPGSKFSSVIYYLCDYGEGIRPFCASGFLFIKWDNNGNPAVLSHGGFPGGSVVKNLPAMQETWVQSLGREDPLEKEMATHSSILA